MLVVQCDYNRAELITNFDVYGQQESADFFDISCTSSVSYSNGWRIVHYTVNATPLTVDVMMHGYNGVTQPLTLTVDSASWQATAENFHTESGR